MVQLPKVDPIEYLVGRCFPLGNRLKVATSFSNTGIRPFNYPGGVRSADAHTRQDDVQDTKAYRAELKAKSREKIAALLIEEKNREATYQAKMSEIEEQGRFFNR